MKNNNWLLKDNSNNIWNFYLDNEHNLIFSVRKDGRWIDNKFIDRNVIEFYVDIDCNNDIHVIYICDDKLKYCIIIDKKLTINTIYDSKNSNYIMKEIKLVIVDNVVYIFCLIPNVKTTNEFILMNYVWDRKNVRKYPVCSIKKKSYCNNYYDVELFDEKYVYVFYNDENNIYAKNYMDGKWGEAEKVIDINKNIREYNIISNKNIFNLLIVNNFLGKYELVNVKLNEDFKVISKIKYISEYNIDNTIAIIENNEVYLFWTENSNLMISGTADKNIVPRIMSNTDGLIIYNFIVSCEHNISGNRIYGIYPPDKLFLPSDIYDFDDNTEHENQQYSVDDTLNLRNKNVFCRNEHQYYNIDNVDVEKLHSELLKASKLRDDIEEKLNKISTNIQYDKSFIDELSNKLQILLEKRAKLSLGSKIIGIDNFFDYESYKNELNNKISKLEEENQILKSELLKEKEYRENEIEMLKKKIESEHDYFENKSKGIFRKIF